MQRGRSVAGLYGRLSKEDIDKLNAGDDSGSIQTQRMMLRDYAYENGFKIHDTYMDDDYSGFADRPEFRRLLKDAENRCFDTVICKHQSRFTRDMELVEKYIHGLFPVWGIRFISITDNADTDIKGNKKSRQINGLVNEWYSEDLSENIRAVFRKKMEHGQYLGSFACYGYMKDPKDRHKLIIDEEAAEIVRKIFNYYLSGMSTSRIAQTLSNDGVPTPSQYKQSIGLNFKNPNSSSFSLKHGVWAYNTITRILTAETYIGTLIQGREKKVSYKSKKVVIAPESEWVVIKNNHNPIIDEKTFYTVQKLIQRNRKAAPNGNTEPCGTVHLLAGKVLCADCNSTMERSGVTRNKQIRYLRCKLSTRSKNEKCSPHYISQRALENYIIQAIKELIQGVLNQDSNNDILKQTLASLSYVKQALHRKQGQLTKLNDSLKQVQRTITLMYAEKLNGNLSEENYATHETVFDGEKQKLEQQQVDLKKEIEELELKIGLQDNWQAIVDKYKNGGVSDDLTHGLVNDFIDVVFIGEKDEATGEQKIIIDWLF